jgi:hypothetical protein
MRPAYQTDNVSALPSPRFEMLSAFSSIRLLMSTEPAIINLGAYQKNEIGPV